MKTHAEEEMAVGCRGGRGAVAVLTGCHRNGPFLA